MLAYIGESEDVGKRLATHNSTSGRYRREHERRHIHGDVPFYFLEFPSGNRDDVLSLFVSRLS